MIHFPSPSHLIPDPPDMIASAMHTFSAEAQWICAPGSKLKEIPVLHNPDFPAALFLYGQLYIRQHLRKVFDLEELPVRCFCSFSCENKFDIFINGTCVAEHSAESGKVDLLPFLRHGDNILMLRVYQTASPDRFVSAVTGGIRLEYKSGNTEEMLTDPSFCDLWLATFWEKEEWKDFATSLSYNRQNPVYSGTIHPRSLRRSMIFRKEFGINRTIRSAVLLATSNCMGLFYINGEPADDAVLQPGATEKRREYRAFDLTSRLKQGKNVIAAMTGNGWTNCESWGMLRENRNAVIADLKIVYEDGSEEEIVTDTSWKAAFSPLTDNDLQYGERYDANLEIPNWDRPGETLENWFAPEILSDEETARIPPLVLQRFPPVRAVHTRPMRLVTELKTGMFPSRTANEKAWLFTADRNIAGSVCLRFRDLRKGQKIGFFFAERLHENNAPVLELYGAVVYPQDSQPGGIAQFNLRGYSQYTAAGRATETFSTRFTYTGFRYAVVTGLGSPAELEQIEAQELHTDLARTGTFSCGNDALNTIWDATVQSWFNNCFNGPTDCPTREKNFWNGDMQIFSRAACWISDTDDFLGNWTRYGRKLESGVYGWEDETCVLPYTLYQFYGNQDVLRDQYPEMLDLVRRRTESEDMILPEKPYAPYRDWLNPTNVNVSEKFFGHCWYLRMLDLVSCIAGILGDTAKAEELSSKSERGKQAFMEQHFDVASGRFREDVQCSYVLALAFHLVPENMRKNLAARLAELIRDEGHQTTGFHGTRYLFDVLSEFGYADLALALLERREFPSWLNMLEGLTSIPESWRGIHDKDLSSSMTHFSFGACCAWFFEYLGGFSIDECEPGLKKVVLRPHAMAKIGQLEVRYKTPYGEICSAWKYVNGQAEYTYSAPKDVQVEFHPAQIQS